MQNRKPIKLLGESKGENIHLELDKEYFNIIPIPQLNKEKKKIIWILSKGFTLQKISSREWKDRIYTGRKCLQSTQRSWGQNTWWTLKTHRKKTNSPIKKWSKDLDTCFPNANSTSADRDVEQLEWSYIAGRTAKWCDHSGKRFVSFLRRWTYT